MTYCTGYPNRCNCISKPLQYPFATGVKCIGSQTAALDIMQHFSGILQQYVTAAYELICGSEEEEEGEHQKKIQVCVCLGIMGN